MLPKFKPRETPRADLKDWGERQASRTQLALAATHCARIPEMFGFPRGVRRFLADFPSMDRKLLHLIAAVVDADHRGVLCSLVCGTEYELSAMTRRHSRTRRGRVLTLLVIILIRDLADL